MEVFRDKQGVGAEKGRGGEKEGKEEVEDAAEKDAGEEGAVENETKLDLENGEENRSSEPKKQAGD